MICGPKLNYLVLWQVTFALPSGTASTSPGGARGGRDRRGRGWRRGHPGQSQPGER